MHQDDAPALAQPGAQAGAVQGPVRLADGLRVGVLAGLERVVDDQQVGAPADHRPVEAAVEILRPLDGRPVVPCFQVWREPRLREDCLIGRVRHDVSRLPAVLGRQARCVRGTDDLDPGLVADRPGDRPLGDVCALGSPGRRLQQQALDVAVDHLLDQ